MSPLQTSSMRQSYASNIFFKLIHFSFSSAFLKVRGLGQAFQAAQRPVESARKVYRPVYQCSPADSRHR